MIKYENREVFVSLKKMKLTELKNLIKVSGKRGIVTYKGKETRTEFDESISQKKINLITSFMGNQTGDVAKILSS